MGCPDEVVVPTDGTDVITGLDNQKILFDLGKFALKPGITRILSNIVAIMNKFPNAKFVVEGHTDSSGGENVNSKLSANRAKAVKRFFVRKGVDASRLTTKGYGANSPVASNATKAGRAKNRRVEVKVNK